MIFCVRMLAFWLAVSGLSNIDCTRRVGLGSDMATIAASLPKQKANDLPAKARVKVASLRRTACFGNCPVFLVEIWSDGQITWQGDQHVSRLGAYTTSAPTGWVAELMQAGEQSGFFDLANHYPINGRPVPDLPQTIITLRRGEQEHQVIDNADAPLSLLHFESYWQEKLEMLSWKRVMQ